MNKQSELGEILEDFYDGDIRQSDMGKAKYAILDWHNKQTEELLDRLECRARGAFDYEADIEEYAEDVLTSIEAERNKLKENTDE